MATAESGSSGKAVRKASNMPANGPGLPSKAVNEGEPSDPSPESGADGVEQRPSNQGNELLAADGVQGLPVPLKRPGPRLTDTTPRSALASSPEGEVSAQESLLLKIPGEVMLHIFSYLLEQDLCRVGKVCRRFRDLSSDKNLWRGLYQTLFEYDWPLYHSEQCIFNFVSPDDPGCYNPWKESFGQLYKGIHVSPQLKAQQEREPERYRGRSVRFFDTIPEALNSCESIDRPIVFVHRGNYKANVIVSTRVSLIGAAPGNVAEHVIIEHDTNTTVTFREGSHEAYLGYLTVKFMPEATTLNPNHMHHCMEIKGSSPTVDHCVIRSSSPIQAAVNVNGPEAEPCLRSCNISHCQNVGLCITDNAKGIYENNEISHNAFANLWIKKGANPIICRNHIHHGGNAGVFVSKHAEGYFEGNDVHSNKNAGFKVETGANPTVTHCEIHRGLMGGIHVMNRGCGNFTGNNIHRNNLPGVWISSDSNASVLHNDIHKGNDAGIYVSGASAALIEYNNVYDNSLEGIEIEESDPIVRYNKIHHNQYRGVYVHLNSKGLIEENEFYNNAMDDILVTKSSTTVLKNNRIHSGRRKKMASTTHSQEN